MFVKINGHLRNPQKSFWKAGGLKNRLGLSMALTAPPNSPKVRVETHHWAGLDSIKLAKGKNYKIKSSERDELVKSCEELLQGKDKTLLLNNPIEGILAKLNKITGLDLYTFNRADMRDVPKPEEAENTLSFFKDPNGAGFYELNVAGFSERSSIIIPKKRVDGAGSPRD